jgi:urease accessory protein
MTLRATSLVRARYVLEAPWQTLMLSSMARHLRRKLIVLPDGEELLVDLEKPVKLEDRDCLILEDGRLVQIIATDEDLLEISATDAAHLTQLAWHLGNRHLEAQIESSRILIRRDHVIAKMLEQLGAKVTTVRETFTPEHGAYVHDH